MVFFGLVALCLAMLVSILYAEFSELIVTWRA
jgi:hypothetical protein